MYFVLFLQRHGAIVTRFFAVHRVLLVSDPVDIEHVLRGNFANYVKGHKFGTIFGDILGQGIFAVDGYPWQVCLFLCGMVFFFLLFLFLLETREENPNLHRKLVIHMLQLQRKLAARDFSTCRFRTFQFSV